MKWKIIGGILALVGLLTLVLVCMSAVLKPPSPLAPHAKDFTLSRVTVINPTLGRQENINLSVQGTVITDLSPASEAGTLFTAYEGSYVLPGLIDMHAHLPGASALQLGGYISFLYMSHGVTSIRETGDGSGTAVPTARDAIAKDLFPGPRIFSCGPFVVGTPALRWPNSIILEDPADADRVATEIKAQGNICIKSYEDLTIEKLRSLKEAAIKHGLQFIGHVPSNLSYEEAELADVQHLFGVVPPSSLARDHLLDRATDWHAVNDARMDEIVAFTLEHGIINTPTLVSSHNLKLFRDYKAAVDSPSANLMPRLFPLVVWNPEKGLPYWHGIEDVLPQIDDAVAKKMDLVGRLYRAGARLQLGTDSQQPFVTPGLSLQQEMRLFVEAGIPLEEVWAIGTWKTGDTMPVPELGRLQADAPADFLIFSEDPTVSLDALESLQAVVVRGKLYTREDIDAARDVYLKHFREGAVDAISLPIARWTVDKLVLRDY